MSNGVSAGARLAMNRWDLNNNVRSLLKATPEIQFPVIPQMQDFIGNKFYEINAFFGEEGVTGKRDAAIFAQYMENKKDKTSSDGWTCDPYDSTFQKDLLMNLSEEQFYDRYFPNHPLTKCRELIKFIKENN